MVQRKPSTRVNEKHASHPPAPKNAAVRAHVGTDTQNFPIPNVLDLHWEQVRQFATHHHLGQEPSRSEVGVGETKVFRSPRTVAEQRRADERWWTCRIAELKARLPMFEMKEDA